MEFDKEYPDRIFKAGKTWATREQEYVRGDLYAELTEELEAFKKAALAMVGIRDSYYSDPVDYMKAVDSLEALVKGEG
jgi:hypothetical protein